MAHATLSLLGLYNYDTTILDGLRLPEAMEPDRETIKENLLLETAELEVVYPDPDIMKKAIKAWSSKEVHVWEELYKTTQYEYNPIWNKEGNYEETYSESRDNTQTRDMKTTRNLKDNTSENVSGNSNSKDYVFGYNSSSAAQSGEHSTTTGGTDNVNVTSTGTIDDDGTIKDKGTITHNIKRKEYGNIGVTTTQAMIKEQRDVVLFNMMDVIIRSFTQRFCLLIY